MKSDLVFFKDIFIAPGKSASVEYSCVKTWLFSDVV